MTILTNLKYIELTLNLKVARKPYGVYAYHARSNNFSKTHPQLRRRIDSFCLHS